jgi:hypothetical protein
MDIAHRAPLLVLAACESINGFPVLAMPSAHVAGCFACQVRNQHARQFAETSRPPNAGVKIRETTCEVHLIILTS